jgi:hypothetical protein
MRKPCGSCHFELGTFSRWLLRGKEPILLPPINIGGLKTNAKTPLNLCKAPQEILFVRQGSSFSGNLRKTVPKKGD